MSTAPDTLAAMRERARFCNSIMPATSRDVQTLAGEVERLSALEAVAHRHHHACLGACGCSVCDWIVASRKAAK